MSSQEAALIEKVFERLADASEDITPDVYEDFFAMRPDCKPLFDKNYSQLRGHMLNEIFTCLYEQANNEKYVDALYPVHVGDHRGMGVDHMSMYSDFLTSLVNTVERVLGDGFPADEREAFERQCKKMEESLREAATQFKDIKI